MAKFNSLLAVLLLMSVSFTAHAQGYSRGDVDKDGSVNISDVTCLIDNLLKGIPEGDVDQDGTVNISDVTSLIDYLLKGSWSDDPVTPPDSHEWVDLGLPSGTLWATCNVGASAPEDCGDYFAWGETTPKSVYNWSTYKWCNGDYDQLTKYNTDSNNGYNGFTDGKTELALEDDVAYVNWGPLWRMPTTDQQRELFEKCSSVWTTHNGVNGRLFTSPNGNTLFLPAAGYRMGESLLNVGTYGVYWSRTLSSNRPDMSCYLRFGSYGVAWDYYYRFYGFTVRAVRVP